MKVKNCIILYIFVFFLSNFCFGQERKPENERKSQSSNAVITIDEHEISKDQVFDLMAKRYPAEVQEAIRELMIQRIIRIEYKLEGIRINADIARQKAKEEIGKLRRDVETKSNWQDYLKSQDISEKELENDTIQRWKYSLSLQSVVKLSQIRETRVDARQIMVDTQEKAVGILQRLKNRENFENIARHESLSETRKDGGKFPLVFRGDLPPSLEKAIFSLPENAVSDVIQSPWGYHIVQVIKIYPGRPQETWNSANSEILESIVQKPVSQKDIQRWLNKTRKKYKIVQVFRP